MAKYYLYILFSIFIFLNGVSFFEKELKKTLIRESTLMYKIEKLKLYATQKKEVEKIILHQKNIFLKNINIFFLKKKRKPSFFLKCKLIFNLLQNLLMQKLAIFKVLV